jgi:hypothetical protein
MAIEISNMGDQSKTNEITEVLKDIPLSTSKAWGEWLAEQERIALQVYEIKPSQLIADQRREQGISRDYKGREVLELLQNAADAAKKANQRGKVRIELTASELLVANSGVGFSTGGVKSLQTADLSPKRSKNSKLIGSKGLGFRSVLNWSRHPVILSGELQIAYNSLYSDSLIENLLNESPSMRAELASEDAQGEPPVPLLPFPIHLSTDTKRSYVEASSLLARCETLKAKGYDTVIAMPFDQQSGYENALEQLRHLRPEFLLFSEWIETLEVSIESEEYNTTIHNKIWRSKFVEDDLVSLSEHDHNSGNEPPQKWRLFSKQGDIPRVLLRDKSDPESYHLVVALQEVGLAKPANLYSFFPTSISLPLHALCHASLDLTQNRKHLQEGESNSFVLQQLAKFIAIIIEQQIAFSGDDYRAIDLLSPSSLLLDYSEDIRDFQIALIEEIKKRCIMPTVSNSLVTAENARSLPTEVKDFGWLPQSVFPSIVKARNLLDKQLSDSLGINELTGDEFIMSLRDAELSIKQRAEIAQGIISSDLDSEYCYQGLLLDASGKQLSEDDSVYLPGGSLASGLVFPEWAHVKILNKQLWELLRTNKVRDSAKALSVFGVQEFSLGNLISGLASAANRAVKKQHAPVVRSELLRSFRELYSQYSDENRPGFPVNVSAFLLNRKGEWIQGRNLYFSSGYSQDGEIVSRLYKKLPGKLIAMPSEFSDLDIEMGALNSFLKWLGVLTWPKEFKETNVAKGFSEYAFPKLDYPAVFSERDSFLFKTVKELPRVCRFQSVSSLDGIDSIVTSESDAILAWLAKDTRAITWSMNTSNNGILSFVPSRHQNARIYKGKIPSYIRWKIKYSPWLNSSDGTALAPVDCMVNDASVTGVFPRPVAPTKEVMDTFFLNPTLLKHAWLNAGVREGVEDLDSEEIYTLLLKLPIKDPQGRLAKKLYNWLIKTVDFDLDKTGASYLKFIDEGVILAQQGDNQGYFPVKDVYHVDIEGFPLELLKSLPVASLLKKRGAEKVRELFGVNVLDKVAVKEKVVHHSAGACTEEANNHFQLSKKYIEIYRHNHSAKPKLLRSFSRLELIVCSQIQSQITFKNETLTNQLPPWTYSIQDDQLFVSCDPAKVTNAFNPLLANAIGDAIASIFGLNEGTPFAQIYQCDDPSRPALLGKMLGDELDDDLDEMLQALNDEAAGQVMPEPTVTMGAISASSPTVISPVPAPKPAVRPDVAEPAPADSGWNVPLVIGIEPVEHVPEKPSTHVGVRVSDGGGGGGPSGTAAASDGKAGESLAMLFEEEQGRFPLYIGHITGYETITADVLSFRSVDERNLFESGDDQSAGLVERVIEAKEKWAGGRVKLTTNEVNTAAEWKGKYFIYRFKPINVSKAEYELKILKNPLNQLQAINSTIEISLDTASTTEQFILRGNISE